MTVVLPIPLSREDVTAGWLQDSLRLAGVLSATHTVVHIVLRDMDQPGQTSDTVLVDVKYCSDADDLPETLVLKFSHPSPVVRQQMSVVSCYEREVNFYRDYSNHCGIAVPCCYVAHYDADNHGSALLLEYIAGARVGSFFDFSLADMQMAVSSLAIFHATWWGRHDAMGGLFDDGSRKSVAIRRWLVSQALDVARECFVAEVSEQGITALSWWLENAEALATASRQRQRTMVHGDCHLQQMLFPSASGGRFAVIDWQTVAIGCGAHDLARLVITAMDPVMRRQHEGSLLVLYHDTLQKQGVQDYTMDDLRRDYGEGLLLSLATNAVALVGLDLDRMMASMERPGSVPWYERIFHWPAQAVCEYGVVTT